MTNKRIRRFLSSVLAIVMVLSLCTPCLAAAAELQDSQSQELTQETDAAESEAAPAPESVKETEPESTTKTEPETETEAAPAPESVKETEPESTTKTEPVTETEAASEPETLSEKQPEDSVTPDALEQTEAQDVVDGEHVTDSGSAQDDEKEARDAEYKEDVSTDKTTAPEKVQTASESFSESISLDGVVISVNAEPGVFPEGSVLKVAKVEASSQRRINGAVEEAREEGINVAASYAFDIKVIGPDGEEVQPADGKKVHVSFSTAEVADRNLKTQVYHIAEEENGAVTAEKLDVHESGDTATAQTDGFSLYTVEFTYDNLQYVMEGDTSVALADILKEIGLTGEATAVEVSRPDLFSASNETGEWVVTAHKAFTSTEWMKITINNIVYEIVVTDATAGFFIDKNFLDSPGDSNCYLIYGTRSNGSGWGISVHRYQDTAGKLYWAYCLDWGKDSSGSGSSPDTAYSISSSIPTSSNYHGNYVSSYALAVQTALLGYGNQTNAEVKRMFGLSQNPNSYEYYQATQAAMWAVIKSGADSEPEPVSNWPFKVRAAPSHANTIGVSLANQIADAAYAIYKTPPTITLSNFTQSSLSIGTATYKATVNWTNCYGGFDLEFSGLPSGYSITRSGAALGVSGNKVSSTATSGQATITVSIPRQSTAKTVTANLATIIRTKSRSLKYGTANSKSKQNFMYIAAQGSPITSTKTFTVPASPPPFKITVNKTDGLGNAVEGAVMKLQEYNGTTFVDTGRTATTNASGIATFNNCEINETNDGKYRVREVSVPTGYKYDGNFFATIAGYSGGWRYQSSYTDAAYEGASSNSTGTNTSLNVYLPSVSPGGTTASDVYAKLNATGKAEFGGSPATMKVIHATKGDYTVYVVNPPVPFDIVINKEDGQGNKVANVWMELLEYDGSNFVTTNKFQKTDANGQVSFTNLKITAANRGRYRVREAAPTAAHPVPDGYEHDGRFFATIAGFTGGWRYQSSYTETAYESANSYDADGNIITSVARLKSAQTPSGLADVYARVTNTEKAPATNGVMKVIHAAKSGNKYVYTTRVINPPIDKQFTITINKRDLNTGEAVTSGVEYQLYRKENGNWTEWQEAVSVDSNGQASWSLVPEDSSDMTFMVKELDVTNPNYVKDDALEVIVNPDSGEMIYASSFVGRTVATADGTEVEANVNLPDGNTDSRPIMKGVKDNSDGQYDFTIWQDDARSESKQFNITVNKRDLNTGEAVTSGIKYQLYRKENGVWTAWRDAVGINSNGVATWQDLNPAESSDKTFMVKELEVTNPLYVKDDALEVIVNPDSGEMIYVSSLVARTEAAANGTDVVADVDLLNGNTDSRPIMNGVKDDSDDQYDFTIWQDDAREVNQNLTVSKVVEVDGTEQMISDMTFSLMHKKTDGSWEKLGDLEEATPLHPGEYRIPQDSGVWRYTMTNGDYYRVDETTAPDGVVNSGWKSPEFQWREDIDLDLRYKAEDYEPKGYLGVQKVNEETGAALSGVEFTVTAAEDIQTTVGGSTKTWYATGTQVAKDVTDANGLFKVENLPYGTYIVTETSHPDEFHYEDISFSVTVDSPADYSGSTIYTDPQIGVPTYPDDMATNENGSYTYVVVNNSPVHPSTAVAKLTERSLNPDGQVVAFDDATGRYTEEKIPGTYYNDQHAKFTLTATNTGDVDLYDLNMKDVMSPELWTTVKRLEGARTSDVTFRQVNNEPLALGAELRTGSTITTAYGETVTVTNVTYDDANRTFNIWFDKLEVGDSFNIQITYTLYNNDNINKQNLPNDVYLYAKYLKRKR